LAEVDTYLKHRGARSSIKEKLGEVTHYDALMGKVAPYFAQKYAVNTDAVVLAGTGDNPATLLGCGGQHLISLGSSYTVCGIMERIRPSDHRNYNIFGYTRGTAMALSVITNGSKVHDHFLRTYFPTADTVNLSPSHWQTYTDAVGSLALTGEEKLMLPYLMNESVLVRKKGIYRENFSKEDPSANIRALHLSQVLSLKYHSNHIGQTGEICVVGGGARNAVLRQWIADAFSAETYTIMAADVAAPLGCAISGARYVLGISYVDAARRFIKRNPRSICRPLPENLSIIPQLLRSYTALEAKKMGGQVSV